MFNLETKQGKLANALVTKGESLTAAQITKRFGVKNPTATISDIRALGYTINANTRKAKNGLQVTEYVAIRAKKATAKVTAKATVKAVAKASSKKAVKK